jgi:phage terminase large subunit-like protein
MLVPAPGSDIARWRRDPCLFIETMLVDPEAGKFYALNDAEREFIKHAFAFNSDGTLKHVEWIFGAIKKSGKSAFAALLILVVLLLFSPPFSEAICASNDYEQSVSRTFRTAARVVAASPALAGDAVIGRDKITFKTSQSTISAISSDAGSAAGSNASIVVFDELWAYTSERSRRLWDEMTPPPTRKFAVRLTVTYAGYSGESELLEEMYKRGMAGRLIGDELWSTDDGLLMAWHTKPIAPWQTTVWLKRMEANTRKNAFLRLFRNQWVTTEGEFIPLEWFDRCVDGALSPVLSNPGLPVWIGIDASVKRDSTAIVAVTYAEGKVRLVAHRIFQPSTAEPLDFEATIERTVLELRGRFSVQAVRYDPYQMAASAGRLRAAGVPAYEFPQSVPNLTEASSTLYELFQGGNIVLYEDESIRRAVERAVAVEMPRGWRISKISRGDKVDVLIALGISAVAAVQASATTTTAGWAAPYVCGDPLAAVFQPTGPTMLPDDWSPSVGWRM